jgi:hypothetical protein
MKTKAEQGQMVFSVMLSIIIDHTITLQYYEWINEKYLNI